jgi:hypothetical protein
MIWRWRFPAVFPVGTPISEGPPGHRRPSAASGSHRTWRADFSRKGERIYHMPGDRDYDRVHMDKGFGERWFRSEEQAVASGWRDAGVR